jgi:hypothetical protein
MSDRSSPVKGLAAAKAAFRRLEPVFRERIAEANAQTAQVIALIARQRVRRRFGILADHIATSVSRVSGVAKVGLGPRETVTLPDGRGTEQPTHIGHMVEFGTAHSAAFGFMLPAAESERENHLQRVRAAGRQAEQQLGAAGGGLL